MMRVGKCVINYFDFAHIYYAVRVIDCVFLRTDYYFGLIQEEQVTFFSLTSDL